MSRSFSDRTRLFFSRPATTRSIASSKSAISTAFFSLRAANRAASLTMFARSAPANPGVRAAITPRSTPGASTTARACSLKIASRPLRTVRRGHDDDALRGVEAVHLGQELVQGLLALVVAPDEPGAAGPRLSDRVERVDEDDARRLVLGLFEQVADARGAH